jgi:hypothetical protein
MRRKSTLARVLTHPLHKTHFLKCPKFWKIIFIVYLDILCSLTKFHKKETYFLACVKKISFDATNCYLRDIFCFLTQATRNIFFLHKTLVDEHRMLIYTQNFLSRFFDILNLKCIFHHRCICSYERKHHVPNEAVSQTMCIASTSVLKFWCPSYEMRNQKQIQTWLLTHVNYFDIGKVKIYS